MVAVIEQFGGSGSGTAYQVAFGTLIISVGALLATTRIAVPR